MTKEMDEKEARKEALKARSEANAAEEKRLNEGRNGVGTRVMVGMSRGKNPVKVVYEAFDEEKAETLPKTVSQFLEITKTSDEADYLKYLIEGYNSIQYTTASDPIAEFVDDSWLPEVKTQFRNVVRNYSKATGVSIEDAVALIKPGIVASQKK